MKKLYTLLSVVALSAAMNAQTNLVENGNLETWVSNTEPANFAPVVTPSINNFLTKEGTLKHGGDFSARQQSVDASSSTQYFETTELIDVIPGHSYTISYWYLDNSPTAKTRIWSSWLPADNTTALANDAETLRYADETLSYSADSPNWVNKTLTLTAPAAAGRFRFQVRTYREAVGAGGGYIYYDDLSFVDNDATASVATQEIAGLKLFPNPLNSGATLNITSNNTADKSVAIFDILGKQVFSGATVRGTVNTSNLTAGVYIVKITEGNKTATRKLVVQ